ncbi:MAG: hypothetical protein HETSPECPRED_003652 [Heterodermia speciosa]|uniref:Non-haem dioxygenase N-terminal domain-containing protein n=1 Tax=Heterodermia speciosa TaxID=116794 RepID=A0A8H3IJS0_9LECA|nr:MAG: hypothetical protein HETSPECPRED_003652 [Heterodermia speciosa]
MCKIFKKFFALQLEEKMNLDKAQNDYNRGYEVMYGQMIEKNTKPSFRSGYYIAQDLPPDHPQVLNKKFAHGPNL